MIISCNHSSEVDVSKMMFIKLILLIKMTFTSYCVEIFIILAIILGKYILRKKVADKLNEKLPGPTCIPIIGNVLTLWGKNEDVFQKLTKCISQYASPMSFWVGRKLIIIFRDPGQAEKIFSCSALTNKDDNMYKFVSYFDGDGLITGSGPKWKKDRRLMSPLFLKRNVMQYFPVILRHSRRLVDILDEKVDSPTFDVLHYIHNATTDFVNETIIGIKTNAQGGELKEFIDSVNRAYLLIYEWMVKPWWHIEWLHRLTAHYKELKSIRNFTQDFFYKSLRFAKENHSHLGRKDDEIRSLLDQMLDIRDEVSDFATDEQIVYHLVTFFTASEDTVTSICSFALVMLGMYPEYQNNVADEISKVVGFENDIQIEHLQKLDCLEMIIKETLRLFPIAPFLLREASQNIVLEGYRIPKGTSVNVAIYNMHRDRKHWEKPNEFYPEHFLPEAIEKRHPYAYLPFSAGVRGCVGKPYAQMAMKTILASILQKYIIEADGKIHSKALTIDISVRFKDRLYPIRIKRRPIATRD